MSPKETGRELKLCRSGLRSTAALVNIAMSIQVLLTAKSCIENNGLKSLSVSRVEAGRNTSTVIPASRKRRRKGNPVVSDETVMSPPRL
jgi:hypothetical protein